MDQFLLTSKPAKNGGLPVTRGNPKGPAPLMQLMLPPREQTNKQAVIGRYLQMQFFERLKRANVEMTITSKAAQRVLEAQNLAEEFMGRVRRYVD